MARLGWVRSRVSSLVEPDRFEGRLLKLAALFLIIYAIAISLSPAARAGSWNVDYRWNHWIGVFVWLIMFLMLHELAQRYLPNRDPFMLPLAGLLSGWGLLIIWRLLPDFGLRQSIWLLISAVLLMVGMRMPSNLNFLRRYKYLWLTGSLILTGLTIFFGTNPLGYGPHMWLGCCGVYLQPSEPLKLLLIAYLAAYFADSKPLMTLSTMEVMAGAHKFIGKRVVKWGSAALWLPLLAPTIIMTGLALIVLVVQRDLGTASVFLLIYAAILYMVSGRKRFLILAVLGVIAAGFIGYYLFDVVRLRVDAWLNPWFDPSGRSYQIVQSLLALANGGIMGRGPGIGNPGLVPVSHSDLIFTAIVEENGLIGAIALVILLGLLASRGLRTAMYAPDMYRRYLAAGLTVYLVGQSIMIIGGSIRLVPLTGITLPFISYGGSSLLTSFLSLLLLLHISDQNDVRSINLEDAQTYQHVGGLLLSGLIAIAFVSGWWTVFRSSALLTRTDNPRRAVADRSVRRGAILDRRNVAVNATIGHPGSYRRYTFYPELSNIVGYTNSIYGQSGLEASLDEYLRGLRGNPSLTIWWSHLLNGLPPQGVDVRLTLDLEVQRQVDALLGEHNGAVVLMNAKSGEILAISSHPTFDANQLEEIWDQLIKDPDAPLLNRAVLGFYPGGDLEDDLFGPGVLQSEIPQIRIPQGENKPVAGFSPLEICLAAAAVSAAGERPAPLLVGAVNIAQAGWVRLPPLETSYRIMSSEAAELIASDHVIVELGIWQKVAVVFSGDLNIDTGQVVTWYVGGSMPDWQGTPFAIAIILEEKAPSFAESIGQQILRAVIGP